MAVFEKREEKGGAGWERHEGRTGFKMKRSIAILEAERGVSLCVWEEDGNGATIILQRGHEAVIIKAVYVSHTLGN